MRNYGNGSRGDKDLMNSNDKDYLIHLPVFDGPFDLLLHLIRENQVDIYDIPIALITEQYMEYLNIQFL